MSEVQVKPGDQTSEHKVTKSATFFAYFAMVASLIVTYGPKLISSLPEGGTATAIVSAAIGISGALLAIFTNVGFIKSRQDIKIAASEAAVHMASLEIQKKEIEVKKASIEAQKATPDA